MTIRGIEVEVAAPSGGTPPRPGAAPPGPGDEHAVRRAYRRSLEDAEARGDAAVSLESLGVAPGGLSIVASAKIMSQEAIRFARRRPASVRRLSLGCGDLADAGAFRAAAEGYLRHFLEELLWGPFTTVDAIIEATGGVVLIERSNPPFGLALPGGFVDYGESLEQAVRREAREETGLELRDLRQFHTYSDPGRDPRFHTVSTVFTARAEGRPRAGDDAAALRVVAPADIPGLAFAFDHGRVLADWLGSPR